MNIRAPFLSGGRRQHRSQLRIIQCLTGVMRHPSTSRTCLSSPFIIPNTPLTATSNGGTARLSCSTSHIPSFLIRQATLLRPTQLRSASGMHRKNTSRLGSLISRRSVSSISSPISSLLQLFHAYFFPLSLNPGTLPSDNEYHDLYTSVSTFLTVRSVSSAHSRLFNLCHDILIPFDPCACVFVYSTLSLYV